LNSQRSDSPGGKSPGRKNSKSPRLGRKIALVKRKEEELEAEQEDHPLTINLLNPLKVSMNHLLIHNVGYYLMKTNIGYYK